MLFKHFYNFRVFLLDCLIKYLFKREQSNYSEFAICDTEHTSPPRFALGKCPISKNVAYGKLSDFLILLLIVLYKNWDYSWKHDIKFIPRLPLPKHIAIFFLIFIYHLLTALMHHLYRLFWLKLPEELQLTSYFHQCVDFLIRPLALRLFNNFYSGL